MLEEPRDRAVQWAKVIDHTRCIGCHACTTACKSKTSSALGDAHLCEAC